ncbi:MAG: tetratricopeptide repeat protein [Qipengyuania sp.]|nr:tetratricopeptide repeat protein [Qipengyuania sp.]
MGANRSSKDVSHVASLGLNLDEQKAVDRFRKDVVEPSMTSLVILDFWAEWCGPCKALTPVLEKVAADYADKGVVLAKVNVDEEQFIASQFQVRSIPTVYAMFQGQPVADLTNARGESQLKQTLDQLLAQLPIGGAAGEARAEIAQFVAMGEQILGEGDAERAAGIFAQVVEMAPEEPAAHAGLIRALAQAGRTDEAQAALAGAEATPGVADNAALAQARSALELLAERPDESELAALRQQAAENPTNHEVRLAFAEAAFAAGDRDAAADELLAMIQADRDWNEGAARAKLVRIFEAVGLEDAWVVATRRRLSRLLFG